MVSTDAKSARPQPCFRRVGRQRVERRREGAPGVHGDDVHDRLSTLRRRLTARDEVSQLPQALGRVLDARRTNGDGHAIHVRRDAVDERSQAFDVRRPRGLADVYPRAGAGRCWYVGHFWESDVGTIQ